MKILLSIVLLLTAMPIVAAAGHTHTRAHSADYAWHLGASPTTWTQFAGTSTRTPAPISAEPAPSSAATTSPVCFDYGHQPLVGDNYDVAQVDTDLGVLKASGVNCLRLAYYGYGNPGVNYSNGSFIPEKLATIIENWEASNNWHFRLILGGDYDTMSPSDFAAYDQSVLETAKWAQAHGIEQLSLGNEQEHRLSGMTLQDWITHLHTLADKVHAVYGGKVSYEFDSDYVSQYESGGLGSIDLYGINLYCCFLGNTQQAVSAFGTNHVYISEFNNDRGVYSTPESTWAAQLKDELATVESFNIPVYYFAYRDGGDGVTQDRWALETSTGQRHLLAQVLGIVQAQ